MTLTERPFDGFDCPVPGSKIGHTPVSAEQMNMVAFLTDGVSLSDCIALSIVLLLTAGLVLAVPSAIAAPTAPTDVATKIALTAIGQMKESQRILGQFLRFLAARKSTTVLSEKQATIETARFVSGINDPKVLVDLALAAQMKISIYSFMPAADMALWKGLYRNCSQNKSVKADSRCQTLLLHFNCPMQRSAKSRSNSRSEIFARQFQALKIMDSYLVQAVSLERRHSQNKDIWYSVVVPELTTVSDIDVLTDLATGVYCKWSTYGIFDGKNELYNFFVTCVNKVPERPRDQAIDVINYLRCLSSGGAATAELLDGGEARVLGLKMSEYMKRRDTRNRQ